MNDIKKINKYINNLKNKYNLNIKIYNNEILYKNNFKINIYLNEIKEKKISYIINKYIKTAGRILYKRNFGKLVFLKIYDFNEYIQIYINKSFIPNIYFEKIKNINIGDIVGVEGFLFYTKTNELSIKCKKIILITKTLKIFPDKFHKIVNNKIIYRKRYLDLICNINSKNIFIVRHKIINEIRNFLIKKKFIEVETPILQNIPDGADAKPFETKLNFSEKKLYLRISPELYLKKLIVGGFNKIFEINKNFRNEGISNIHNPEFTMIELYSSYVRYNKLILLIQYLFKYIVKKIFNKKKIVYKDIEIDFNIPFKKISMKKSIYIYNKKLFNSIKDLNSKKKCIKILQNVTKKEYKNFNIREIHYELFKNIVEKKIKYPTFITNYPIEISPLSKKKSKNIAERFELFIYGIEICNGFSELNDPLDQSNRFINQISKNKDKMYNYEYIESLEYGLPPCSGLGIGIDRLIMLLTNSDNIKNVILFPNLYY
ncbi:lysine--tRNA ligase [Candidatus Nardonella dryophthoridicola]|uniref:Lysine--tRNA ligase n=1 Tax=endosymbiont of Rhynchophorus ferrugineus TaxID=1972133 RepID=A0A2Z5T3J7_9GAMM|nr:lysine--tRNA ligase [Candidatus Nardonella dryophthoridicola]BBA84967.1 lysyl-tRNA synthetase [endosymbiont of Rhynchophorus ferrugineus]